MGQNRVLVGESAPQLGQRFCCGGVSMLSHYHRSVSKVLEPAFHVETLQEEKSPLVQNQRASGEKTNRRGLVGRRCLYGDAERRQQCTLGFF